MTSTSFRPCDAFKAHPYESSSLRAVTGPTLRPGGMELTRSAVGSCRLATAARALDVGCGPGASSAWLRREAGLNAFGLDRSPVLLSDARRDNPGLPLVQADAACLPFADGTFEMVLTECVLSLIAAPDPMLAECRRVLIAGGWLVLTDLYRRCDNALAQHALPPDSGCPTGARSREEMQSLATSAGFDINVWEDHSGHLKRLAADLVWAFGSLAPFRRHAAADRIGFCLMVCRRKDTSNG